MMSDIEELIKQLEDEPDAMDRLAALMSSRMRERSGDLRDAEHFVQTRVLSSGLPVTADSAGVTRDVVGESYFDTLNFLGSVSVQADNPRQANISAGGGAPCYDFIVDPCYTGVSGTTLSTFGGCPVTIYKTLQEMATTVSARPGSSRLTVFVCPGTYNEDVLFTGPSVGTVTIIGAGVDRVTIAGQASGGAALAHSLTGGTAFYLSDLSIVGHNSALSKCLQDSGGSSYWRINNVVFTTGSQSTSLGIVTGVTGLDWQLSDCRITGSGIGFADSLGGDFGAPWGGVQLINCSVTTAIGARFVNDASFFMSGGEFTGAVGLQHPSGFTSTDVFCTNVQFRCATAGIQCTLGGGFNDLELLGCGFVNCLTAIDYGTSPNTSFQNRIEGCNFQTNAGTKKAIDDSAGALSHSLIVGNTFTGYTAGNEIIGVDPSDNQMAHNDTDSGTNLPDSGVGHTGTGGAVATADPLLTFAAAADLTNYRQLAAGTGISIVTSPGNGAAETISALVTAAAKQTYLSLGTNVTGYSV